MTIVKLITYFIVITSGFDFKMVEPTEYHVFTFPPQDMGKHSFIAFSPTTWVKNWFCLTCCAAKENTLAILFAKEKT